MTTSAFPTLTTAETIFKNVVWDPMILAGETWIEGAVPFLDLPVIKQLDEFAIKELTDWIFSQFTLIVDVTAIQLVGMARNSSYQKAQEQLAVIADEQGVTSDAFKTAQTAAIVDLQQFARMGS